MRYDVMNLDLKRLLYEFDLNGFVVTEGALDQELVDALLVAWESTAPGVAAFDLSFGWGGAWVDLIQTGVQRLDPLLSILLGKNYRLDHAFAVTEAFYSSPERLHHQSHMVDGGILYTVQKRRPFTTLLTVGFALLPIKPGKGGFCCVPGSHKAEMDTPREYYRTLDNPHVRQIPQTAGSCVLFTEALTHGTYPIGHEGARRSLLLRLAPCGMTYRRGAGQRPIQTLPALFSPVKRCPLDPEALDEFSKRLLTRPAGVK